MRKVWIEDDYEIRLLRRGKRRLLDIVFGRTMVIVVLLLLQVAIMAFGAHYLGRYYPALSGIMHVLAVVLIIYLVNKPGSATTKITWIVLIMALPAFGVLLYLFVQLDVGHRYANRRVQESIVSTVQYVPRQTELMTRLRTELPEVHNLAEYTLRSGGYPKRMEALGIRCKMFAPLRPFVSTYYNNRDHRKIAVIDGRVGFTGGVNLSDEYANLVSVYGVWKDTAVRLEGEAVRSLTLMFLQMWGMDEREPDTESYGRYLNVPLPPLPEAGGYVLPYADSPLDDERVGESVYLDILSHAERYVRIFTPYLILDETMVMALTFAAKRGVDVELILPHVPDKKFAFALAKGHYRELLDAGVKIYEYTPGFVHAKVFVSDDCKAVVGTINLDYRSLYLHFENAVYLYDCPCIADIVADFDATRAQSQIVTHGDLARIPLHTRITSALLKLVAPLM